MSTTLKCPNPSCPYPFDPTRIPPGAVITCPRCGMRFTLGQPAPGQAGSPVGPTAPGRLPTTAAISQGGPSAYPPPGYPPQPRPASPTIGTSIVPDLSSAGPNPSTPGGPGADKPAPAIQLTTLVHAAFGPVQTAVVVIAGIALLGVVAATIYFQLTPKPSGVSKEEPPKFIAKNVSFDPPTAPWERDDETNKTLNAPILFVLKRTDPEAWIAFGARDFDPREPRPSELRDGLFQKLARLFDDLRDVTPIPNARWLGEPATAYTFRGRGKRDGPHVAGECHAVSYKGVAYWMLCWAGENDAEGLFPTFEAIRDRFKLLKEREKWLPRESTVRPFGGHRYGYQVLDAEGLWVEPDRKDQNPEDIDPKADLLLHAREKRRGIDTAEEAALIVLAIDPAGGDPLAEGRKYVEEQWTAGIKARGGNGLTPTVTEVTGNLEGDPTSNTVEATAPVVRLKATVPEAKNSNELLVVSAIKLGDKLIVVQVSCDWKDRALLEARLVQIAGSLRVRQ